MTPELRETVFQRDDPSEGLVFAKACRKSMAKCFNKARLLVLNSRNNNSINSGKSKYLHICQALF